MAENVNKGGAGLAAAITAVTESTAWYDEQLAGLRELRKAPFLTADQRKKLDRGIAFVTSKIAASKAIGANLSVQLAKAEVG